MCDRDDANLRHFTSRSAQPKIGTPGAANRQSSTAPVNIYVVYDNPFDSFGDRNDNLRFKYMGTSPMVSQYEGMNTKRLISEVMGSAFEGRNF